ncbi:MAG: MATE family efflux transporter [Lachnospiraceae bacterium]|nr:MATE family efflux transporter [Lachnospiraceae bacterium]
MAAKTKDMTKGNPFKLLLVFALPLMVGNIFQQLYTVIDTMIVGQVLGVSALASLGAADWLNWMMVSVVQGFTQGFSIRIAQDFGAGNTKAIRKDITASARLACILALCFIVFFEMALPPFLRVMKTPEDVIGGSLLYLRVLFLGIPIVMAYNTLAGILRAFGNGKAPLMAMVVACFVNIVLDIVFVAFFHWGIAGAAIATVIAQGCSALYCLMAFRRIDIGKPEKKDWENDNALNVTLIKLGLPMAFQHIMICVGGMIVQTVVNSFGMLFIAGFTASNKLYGVLEMAATSYGYAVVTYTGQNLGAGKYDRIKQGVRSALIVAAITSAVISVCMLIVGKGFIGMFLSGTPEEVAGALDIGYRYLAIMSYCLIALYFLYVYRSALQGLGDTMMPMLSGVAEFVMRTGVALLLPMLIGRDGILYAESSAWIGADVILVAAYYYRIHRLGKEHKQLAEVENTNIS